ncbi:17-beta-hydroxysteroid dehydrogenase type 3 isoform X1 [Rhincodon typus]|uniref:17-beta-hydroxysteroid dehydrogenase type 3 isoform X1 n=1 Tax=Rhincodon typus TaxID=259920 RepID=UPI0009A3E964|nr:17-beta-hydroxysteroid dehydrogenase type 3 isoform X1 [Rhincodon typus]
METFLENAFILLGIFAVCNIFLQVTKCLKYLVLTKWAGVPDSFFQSLGEWAVITGGTDGIGKAFAHEFAKCGLNIVLISRTKEKLTKVADEIEQASGREVKTIQVNFIKRDIYQHIKENLRGLEIGVLVNNVGIMQKPDPCRFLEINDIDKTIDDMINVNMVSVVKMTQLVLPKMKERQKGLILNISSGAANAPCPFFGLYSSTKIFVERFSRGCQAEYGSKGIIIKCLMPYGVASAMSQLNPGIITKLAKEYVRSSLDCTLLGERGHGCLPHEILAYVYGKLPQWITYSDVFLDKMRNYLQNRGRSYRNPQP